MRNDSVAILDIRSDEVSFLIGSRGVNGTFVFSGTHTEKYEGYSFSIIQNTSVMYFTFRKMNNESPVFSVRGEAIEKLRAYAAQHDLIPYVVSFCYAPMGNVWVFAELGLIPEAEPKNKTESYYLSAVNQTLFYRVADLKDYRQLGELSKKSISPELYKIFSKKFGDLTAK